MNDYALFYNYTLLGDVMLVQVDPAARPNRTERLRDVTVIYHDEKIVGCNIFNLHEIVKIRSQGFIALPPDPLVDILNDKLREAKLPILPYKQESGFKVGKILTLETHPDSDHLHVVTVSVKDQVLQVVCGAPNVALGQTVVVAMPYSTMPDGSRIIPGELRGIRSEAMLCSARELHLEGAGTARGILVLDEEEDIGRDFFERK